MQSYGGLYFLSAIWQLAEPIEHTTSGSFCFPLLKATRLTGHIGSHAGQSDITGFATGRRREGVRKVGAGAPVEGDSAY